MNPRPSFGARTPALLGVVVWALVLLAGCSGDQPDDPGVSSAGEAPVLQPGEPGDPNRSREPAAVDEPAFSHSDVAFVQMMIPHHAQAIEMAELAERHAVDRRVRVLAERIRVGQGPEIMTMAAWLEEHDLQVPSAAEDPSAWDHGEHGHNGMRGMLTGRQLDRLAAARGRRFDLLFLQLMVQHHRGAVRMAADAAPESTDVRVGEMIADVAAVQEGEIDRMRQLLTRLA